MSRDVKLLNQCFARHSGGNLRYVGDSETASKKKSNEFTSIPSCHGLFISGSANVVLSFIIKVFLSFISYLKEASS